MKKKNERRKIKKNVGKIVVVMIIIFKCMDLEKEAIVQFTFLFLTRGNNKRMTLMFQYSGENRECVVCEMCNRQGRRENGREKFYNIK
jgi:hypothetical protein